MTTTNNLLFGMNADVFNSMPATAQEAVKAQFEKNQKLEAELAKSQQTRVQEGLNQVTLQGRTGQDLELTWHTQKDNEGKEIQVARCFFTLAVPMFPGAHKPTWIPVTVWGKQAEATVKHVGKGSLITVTGVIENRSQEGGGFYTGVRADQRTGLGVIFNKTNEPGSKAESPINPITGELVDETAPAQAPVQTAPAMKVDETEIGF